MKKTLRNSINVAYGKMDDIEKIISFLQSYVNFTQMEEFKFDQLVRFSPNNFLTAMKFAILYEGSLNSQRVQEYTAPLVSRMQSLVESSFSRIFNVTQFKNKESFFEKFLDNSNIVNIDISAMNDSMAEVLIRVLAKIILDYQKRASKKSR